MSQEAEIDRTSAVGLFNFARSYWRSAEQLRSAPPRVTHPDSPITFLLCHATELYLKAYLRGAGRDVVELKRIGHRVADLSRAAVSAGLTLSPQHLEILSHIDDADVAIEARYIVTGFKRVPPNEALSEVAVTLDQEVCAALAKSGLPVRAETFPPIQTHSNSDLDDDAQRVLVYLFKTGSVDDRTVRIMSSRLSMDEGMLKYHLDCLDENGFAENAGGNYVSGDIYWAITPKGRRYAVDRKLVGQALHFGAIPSQ